MARQGVADDELGGSAVLSSVSNALRVLEFLVENGESGVSQVARGLGLTVGTTHRLVGTLTEAGFVERNGSNRRYRAGRKMLDLARLMSASESFSNLAYPHINRLMQISGETASLGVLREDRVVYVARAVTDQPLAVAVSIGSRVPAYCTSLGRAILAFSDENIVDSYIERLPELSAADPQPTPTARELRDILGSVREVKYAEDNAEFSDEISCLAAPIFDARGRVAAAVSISVPRTRITQRRKELIPAVKATAEELSHVLQSLGDQGGI